MSRHQCWCGWLIMSSTTEYTKLQCPQCNRTIILNKFQLGSIVEKTLICLGASHIKKFYTWIFNKPCGCDKRKKWLNALPYQLWEHFSQRWLK